LTLYLRVVGVFSEVFNIFGVLEGYGIVLIVIISLGDSLIMIQRERRGIVSCEGVILL
jgi:hypothetical protein